jgi:hypothetical protein
MANLRTGIYGEYYGSLYGESESLTLTQMKLNATYIYSYLLSEGWTLNAICGLLGNMQAESTINPGRWQSDDVGNTSLGYGLVQWTPATKYIYWATGDPSTMDNNLSRIIYELENNIQWIATSEYDFSFEQFSKSNESVEYLASAFLKCYERAGVEVESTRRSNAKEWLTYFSNGVEIIPVNPTNRKRKSNFKFVLFNKLRRKV